MAETPFNLDLAGAESPADEQAIASAPEAGAACVDPAAVAEPAAAPPAAPEPPDSAEPATTPAWAAAPEPAATPEPPEAPAAAPEPTPEPEPPVFLETVVTAVREELRETVVTGLSQPELSQPEQSQPEPAAPAEAGVAASYEVPALEGAAGAEGGEWELLKAKLSAWLEGAELQQQWDRLQGPLRGLALLIGLVLILRLYSGLIGTLDSLPLVPGLLELVGVIAFARFCLTRLVRTSERERLLADWSRRWQEFRGRG